MSQLLEAPDVGGIHHIPYLCVLPSGVLQTVDGHRVMGVK